MTTALLTLDKGSVLLSPDSTTASDVSRLPDELVTKQVDGELIKIQHVPESDAWGISRRSEHAINFWTDGGSSTLSQAVGGLADRQAFGFRTDGQPAHPLNDETLAPETVEIEPVDRGAILIESERQLPFVVYTNDETYYRIYVTEDATEAPGPSTASVLERRKGPRGEWEELGLSEPSEPGKLLDTLADDAEMISIRSPSGDDLKEAIEGHDFELYSASKSQSEEEQRAMTAVKDDTAFEPTVPKPRPVEFPE